MTHLLIGWDYSVSIAEIKNTVGTKSSSGVRQVTILRRFRFDVVICGVCTWKNNLVVLVYTEADDDSESDEEEIIQKKNFVKKAGQPELQIIGMDQELISNDVLPLVGFETYKPEDYRLECLHNAHETLLYVTSPRTLLRATPRDLPDHIEWLVEQEKFIEALKQIELNAKKLKDFRKLLGSVGEQYLTHLFNPKQFNKNTDEDLENLRTLCPKIFGDDEKRWSTWI
eukprot:UN26410